MDIEIRHARVVTAIAAAGSISRAAALLALPQPSLSAQLRRIERSLGGELFVRSTRGLRPTTLGERLVPMLAELAQQAEAVAAEAQRSRGEQPVIRFGYPGPTPVALSRALQRAVPDHDVETFTMESDAIFDAVADAALTAGLVTTTDPDTDATQAGSLRTELLGSEPICVIVAEEHPLARRDVVTLDEIIDLPWIRRAPGDWYRAAEDRVLTGSTPTRVLHHAGGHAEAARWVRETGAVGLVSPWFIQAGTCLLDLAASPQLDWHVIWRSGGLSEATVTHLTDGLRHFQRHNPVGSPRYWSELAAPRGA